MQQRGSPYNSDEHVNGINNFVKQFSFSNKAEDKQHTL